MTGIVDCGAGNLNSVKKALSYLAEKSRMVTSPEKFSGVDRLLFPGVGSFGHALEKIRKLGFFSPLKEWIGDDRPFLGICLGLQVLFESSEEAEGVEGLGFFQGACKKFRGKKVPQIGWNDIRVLKETSFLKGIKNGEFFYYAHSFYVMPEEDEIILAVSNYGTDYAAVVGRGNVFGVQFHPEKSGRAGVGLIKNWVERC